jgi:uncharacterized protein (TIGR03083 family)
VPIDYPSAVSSDAEALASVLDQGPLDAPVPTCPAWTLSELGGHLGWVHRWANEVVRTGQPPEGFDAGQPDDDVGGWLRDGAATLVETLRGVDLDAPCWNFTSSPQVAAFWPRRQAIETAIHRWDAQNVLGRRERIDADLASDGVDELLTVMRRRPRGLEGSVHVHCTDVAGEWFMRFAPDGTFEATREHAKGDVALRGPASDLLLALWGRMPLDAPGLETIGDGPLLAGFVAAVAGQ